MKKNAIVTGSTSGIGLIIAEILAENGFNIVLNGLGKKEEIEILKSEIKNQHEVKVIYENADMKNSGEIKQMITNAEKNLGNIDLLVNNAGVQYVAPIEDFPEEKWDDMIAINLSAAFHTIKAIIPFMKKRKWGRIINIASTHGLVASANKSAYVTAKHGIMGLTKVVALELANQGITCNAICPGFVYTPLIEKQIRDNAKKNNISIQEATHEIINDKHPIKQFVRPKEIAELILYMYKTDSMTGSCVPLDCGWTAQ